MKIFINGQAIYFETAPTVRELLRGQGEFVAVALNGQCIPRGEQALVTVQDGDQLEILTPHGGG